MLHASVSVKIFVTTFLSFCVCIDFCCLCLSVCMVISCDLCCKLRSVSLRMLIGMS